MAASHADRGTPITGLATARSGSVAAGGQFPSPRIRFRLYPPGDTTCTHPPVFTSTVTIDQNASFSSGPVRTRQGGDYRFTAAYSGDPNNAPASGACGATGEQVTVT